MVNSSFPESNITQLSIYREPSIEKLSTILVILVFLGFFSFLYFMKILLSVYFTTEHVRDSSRYILFAHMLINDTACLSLCLLLMVCLVYLIYLPFSVCYSLVAGISTSFMVTPYNLAVMSIERYVAICFPLRHTEICNVQNTSIAISLMWLFGFIPIVADIITISSSVSKDIFSMRVRCSHLTVTITPLQGTIKSIHFLLSLAMVVVLLVCTYIKIILAAQKCRSSASKASKTLLLHGFQLFLCIMSLTSTFVEVKLQEYAPFLRIIFFLLFMCLPRVLSPLIYGLRDEVFRKYIKKLYSRPLFLINCGMTSP